MPNKQQLSQEQLSAINNYGKDIETLKDTVTAIRKLPGMYCAGKGNKGFLSLIREIYDNAIDQVVDPSSPADYITVYYNMITLEVEVSDNGKGLPFDTIERAVTAQHTSKNYTKKKGEYSSGVHGSGLKVTNALSSECHIQSFRYDGTAMQLDLKEGYVVGKGAYPIKNKECRQGLVVRFVPSVEVLGELSLDWKTVYHLVKDIISLTPVGSRVHFEAVDLNNQRHIEDIVNADGIITKLISSVKAPICKPIVLSHDNGDFKLDIAFVTDTNENGLEDDVRVTAFCNMCPTIAGEHISGSIDGICKWFCNYMNNIYLANQKAKDKLKIMPIDIKRGLNVVISGFCLDVIFVGQDKQQLAVPEMASFCKDVLMNGLEQWSKSNPQDLLKLCKFFKDMGELRMKQDKDKVKIVQKYAASAATGGLPRKYVRPLGKEHIELLIVEGDSAKSDVETGRNKLTQGVFPIRGKIINAFACNKATFFNNEEVQSINQIMFGMPYRRDFKVSDCRVEKIVILSDADERIRPKMLFV